MYVDKRLAGIQAVQTLSRLNRTHPLKEDTFILDFVNERQEIQDAFKVYYEGAEMGDEADPDSMYRLKGELDSSGIYLPEEVEGFCAVYFKPKQRQSAADHQGMNAMLDPGVQRFSVWQKANEDEAELWRGKLLVFRNLYSFLSQIIPYQDSDLEKSYVFLRHLSSKLPKRRTGPAYEFDDDVRLEYYRLQKISEGSISLNAGTARALDGPTEVGTGLLREEILVLSRLIDIVNERFGTDFNNADQLFFDQIVEIAITDERLKEAAAVNPGDKFELVFKNLLETLFVERIDQNEEIFVRFMNDHAFQKVVTEWMASEAYRKLRGTSRVQEVESSRNAQEKVLPANIRLVQPHPKDRYVTCVPLVPLKVAAGAFSDPQYVEDRNWDWVKIRTKRKLHRGMFVAQVFGESMEPTVPDGSYCLFSAPVTGTRQGKIVLVQLREGVDSETGESYTLKQYESNKVADGDSWRHKNITLKPINPAFPPIELTAMDDGQLKVVAEFIEVLSASVNQ
jgi:type I restriction enzyme R subunit